MRVINEQRNPWGAAGLDGKEPQRTDLWIVGMDIAVNGINKALPLFEPLRPVPSYFAQNVALPELAVKADPVRRDSRSYNMPSWDDPLGTTRITFIMDADSTVNSRIYNLLNRWRMLVRAGRGGMGAEAGIVLDDHYRINYAFSITVSLLRGGIAEVSPGYSLRPIDSFNLNLPSHWPVNNDLEYSGQYLLEHAWLGGFKMADLSYEGAKTATIEATFYADNVLDNGTARYE